jgi:hypothetical protein
VPLCTQHLGLTELKQGLILNRGRTTTLQMHTSLLITALTLTVLVEPT